MTNPSAAPIQPFSPALSDIIGALSIGKIWSLIIAMVTTATAIGGAGFALGQRLGEMSAQINLNAMSAQLSKAEAATIIQTERAQQIAERLKQLVDYSTSISAQVAERDRQIAQLNVRLGQANTCDFLQQQIVNLRQQISNVSSGKRIRVSGSHIFSADVEEQQKREAERKAQDDAEIAQLQQQVLAFTQQLNACAK